MTGYVNERTPGIDPRVNIEGGAKSNCPKMMPNKIYFKNFTFVILKVMYWLRRIEKEKSRTRGEKLSRTYFDEFEELMGRKNR